MSRVQTDMVLLDVGSTNSRAWLVRSGEIVASRTAAVGVRDSARDRSNAAVRSAVRQLVAEAAAAATAHSPARSSYPEIAAAGMVTSAQGLLEVAHVPAPASAHDLARGAVVFEDDDVAPGPILLVPGVRTAAAGQTVREDVMRGEETLVVGLLERGWLAPGEWLLNAGSHWKLVAVDGQGRVLRSRTSLGGEIVHAAQTATLLAASLPEGRLKDFLPDWLEAGADASARDGLLRALFAVRLLDQRGDTTPEQRFAWLVGACIAEDLRGLLQSGTLGPSSRIAISGPGVVPAAWAHLLGRHGHEARVLEPERVEQAFVAGLLHIAALHRLEN